jgi:hypothetical protein
MNQIFPYTIFAIACVLAVARPHWGLALVLSMYAFEQLLQASGGIFLSIPPLTNFSVAIVAGIAAIGVLLKSRRPFEGYASPVFWGIVGIFAWSAISLAWTPSFDRAWEMIYDGFPYFVLFVLVAPLLPTDLASIGKTQSAFVYVGTAVCAGLLLNPEFRSSSGRAVIQLTASITSNPLTTGELGGALLIVGALMRPASTALVLKLARVAAFLLGTAIALQSGSRGQVLFAFMIVVVFFPVARRVTSIGGFVGSVLALGFVFGALYFIAPLVLTNYGAQRWDTAVLQGSALGRLNNATDLLSAALSNPMAWVVGLGFNAFTSVAADPSEGWSHNIPNDIFSELGVPMFCIFLAVLWRVAKSGLWLFRRYQDSPVERSEVGVLLALVGYYFLLANKQAHLWAIGAFFLLLIVVERVRVREESLDRLEQESLAAEGDGDEDHAGSEDEDEARSGNGDPAHGAHAHA